MEKKKKIILISVISVIVLCIIIGIVCFIFMKSKNNNSDVSKVSELYAKLVEKESYDVTITKDEKNKTYYAKQGDKAYTCDIYNGEESKFIIRDGNSYLIRESDKAYFTYNNNESSLKRVETALDEIKDLEFTTGKEKLGNKNYKYEEYKQLTELSMIFESEIEDTQEVITRFYFEKDKLAYIKTIVGDKEEILKVEIRDNVDSNLFNIPNDYTAR